MRNLFASLYLYFKKHKILLFSILIIIVGVCVGSSFRLRMNEDIMSVMPKNEETDRVNFVFRNLSSADKMIFKIAPCDTAADVDPDELIVLADAFAESLVALESEDLLKEVLCEVDETQVLDVMDFVWENLPYFLTEQDYEVMDTLLTREKIAETIAQDKEMLTSPMGPVYRQALLADPLHFSTPVMKQLGGFQVSNQYQTYGGHIFSKDYKSLMIFVTPFYSSSDTYHNELLVKKINDLVTQYQQSSSDYRITYFGAAAVAVANARQIKQDSTWSILIALAIIVVLLAFYFRNWRSMVLLLLPIAFGGGFAIAVIALFKGTISAIALGTGSIIFGIAIDYSLHFLIHFREQPSVIQTIKEVSFPLLVGSTTTIAAFVSLMFLNSDLLSDFGFFASFTLIGTILFVLLFLPHFLKENAAFMGKPKSSVWNRIAEYKIENNKLIVCGVVVITIVCYLFSDKVKFESDMHKINYMTQEQKQAFEELSHSTTLSQQLTYVASEGKSLDEALSHQELLNGKIDSLQSVGVIKSHSGIGNFFPSSKLQQERIARWNSFWQSRRDEVQRVFDEECVKAGFEKDAFERFKSILNSNYEVKNKEDFAPLYNSFLKEFLIESEDKSAVVTLVYTAPEYAQNVCHIVDNEENSFAFDATTLTKSMLDELKFDFNYLLWICGMVVLAFLFISFGNFEITLITFLPMTIAFVWILGLMSIFDIRFNIINVILATFIFGIGDDYSIFIMEGLLYEYAYGKKMLSTYKTAVILSAVTMFIGIGALIVAKHPAMFSLAQVTIIGMISVAVVAYVVAPAIFKWMTTRNGVKRARPVTLWDLCKTIFSFLIFILFSAAITVFGFFVLTLGGKTKKHKEQFHTFLCKSFQLLIKWMPQVTYRLHNPLNEDFSKPGVIIANHQSHLDLLYILALNPKIICLTNQWAWKSPFYGAVLRYADFHPVSDGLENSLDSLRKAIDNGYSILVFPEGTRSERCEILKFHQGAFYLAKNLNVDLIPILLHGVGHVLHKGEFILRKGRVTMQILDRISPDAEIFTESKRLQEVVKSVRHQFIEEFARLRNEVETPDYFAHWVQQNYLYKGKSIYAAAKARLKENNNFVEKIAELPDTGECVIVDEGQGEFALMAALVKRELQLTVVMRSEDAIALASHCAARPANLKEFVRKD
ncbi:MAG: MMPL family transporter [Bacteroidales bacterium]|nr:MMPL family transporter [Bacteroidales bacterium]